MNKNYYKIENINNIMALRLPQFRSLEVLDNIMKNVSFQQDNKSMVNEIHNLYPIFREFERAFPSLTFALATGVGKTLLMGDLLHISILIMELSIFLL